MTSRMVVKRTVLRGVLALLMLVSAFGATSHAQAATTCTVAKSGALYNTIQAAVDDTNCTTIDVAAGTYTENVTISRDVTITGASQNTTIVDGNNTGTVFNIQSGTVALTDMTIQHGSGLVKVFLYGGGIYNAGTLTLTNCTISGNNVSGNTISSGGGVYNAGTATVNNCTISGNISKQGGGITTVGHLTLTNSTVSDNSVSDTVSSSGGGMYNAGTATVSHSTIRDNRASAGNGGSGGGIYTSNGTTTVSNSIVSGNSAFGNTSGRGGGIYSTNNSTLTLTDSTISNNSTPGGNGGSGGGIYNGSSATVETSILRGNSSSSGGGLFNSGTATLTNSTLSDNSSSSGGGGIFNSGTATLMNSTLSNNNTSWIGGGIYTNGAATLVNTIVANSSGGDCAGGTVTANSRNNLIEDTSNVCGLTNGTNGNIVGQDPQFESLADNGGPTQTYALLTGNPAIDAGNAADCPSTDQRGNARPQGAGCDIGAYEGEQATPDKTAPTANPSQSPAANNAGWNTSDVTVTWNWSDEDSGLDPSACPASSTSSGEGTLTLTATCRDLAGNEGNAFYPVKVDKTAPTTTGSFSTSGNGATVTLAANDSLSGVASTSYRINGGTSQSYSAPFIINGPGSYIITYVSTDMAGNVEVTKTLSVAIAQPTNGVLDNFNRGNGRPGNNWGGLTTVLFYRIADNMLDVQAGGPLVWKQNFGTSQEAFVTLKTIDTKSPSQGLLLKVQADSAPDAGAISVVYDALAKAVRVSTLRIGDKTWTLYTNKSVTFANGDKLGAKALATGKIEITKNGTLVTTVTLSTKDQAFFNAKGGKLGIWTAAAPKAVMDDFGGGSIAP